MRLISHRVPESLVNKLATVCRPCVPFRLPFLNLFLRTSSWRTVKSSRDLRFFTAIPPTPCVTLGGMVETREGKMTGFCVTESLFSGKTGVTADRDKIEFRLFHSSPIFNMTLREEIFSLPKQNQTMHSYPGFMALVT